MILGVIRRKVETFPFSSIRHVVHRNLNTAELAQLTPEAVLNDKVRTECVKRLKLIYMTKISKDSPNQAAVLVPLCIHNGKIGFLYTLRSNKVNTNRGQVSFPGGRKDESDATLEDTALRETWEELQISKNTIDVWGSGNLIERKSLTILPVLSYIGEIDPKNLKFNKHEVEEAFVVPLEVLCNPAFCRYTQFRNSYTLPTYIGGKHRIWGLTAMITHFVMCCLVPRVYKHKLAYLQPIEGIQDLKLASEAQKS